MMLIDEKKFNEIVKEQEDILATVKEPELYWYQQKHVLSVLDKVKALFKKEEVKEVSKVKEVKEETKEAPKAKTPKVKVTAENKAEVEDKKLDSKDGKDN